MTDPLANFVAANRLAFDVAVPPVTIWTNIHTGLQSGPTPSGWLAKNAWWKLGGLGSLIVGTVAILTMNTESPVVVSESEPPSPKKELIVPATQDTIERSNTVVQSSVLEESIKETSIQNVVQKNVPTEKENVSDQDEEVIYKEQADGTLRPLNMTTDKIDSSTKHRFEKVSVEKEETITPEKNEDEKKYVKQRKSKSKTSSSDNTSKEIMEVENQKSGPDYEYRFDTTLTGVTRFEVAGGSAQIKFRKSKSKDLRIEGEALVEAKGVHNMKNNPYKFVCTRDGNTVYFKSGFEKGTSLIVGALILNIVIEIEVPADLEDLIVESYSGDVALDEYAGKQLKIATSSGNIKIGNSAAQTSLKSMSGDVSINHCKSDVEVRTSSGDVEIGSVIGQTDVKTSSGDMKLDKLNGTAILTTSSGDIVLQGIKGNLKAASMSGDIKIGSGEGAFSISTSTGQIEGHEILLTSESSFKSFTGDISMKLNNKAEELRFELRSSTGDMRIDKDGLNASVEKKFSGGTGNILISGSTSTGDQVYR